MKKRFNFLRTLANIFKILGILLAAISLLGGIILNFLSMSNGNFWSLFGYDASTGFSIGLTAGIITLIAGLLSGLMVYGFGELIYVLISVEENTYKTSVFLEGMQKDQD
jgi:hypothetical protein